MDMAVYDACCCPARVPEVRLWFCEVVFPAPCADRDGSGGPMH